MNSKKVVLFTIFLLFCGMFSYCQDVQSVSTEIQGVIPRLISLSTDMSDIETIDLVNSNSAYLGKIVVFTNTKGVFSIIINSKNFGKLAGMTAGNTDEYPYRLSFGTVDRIDLSSDFRMTYSVLSTDSTIDFPVSVSYDKVLDLEVPVVADTYSDIVTITFSIS